MKPICMAKVGPLNLQRDKAVDNGGLRYGAIESALRPPLPTEVEWGLLPTAEPAIFCGLFNRLGDFGHFSST